ncbi:MAG: hypothetical protein ACI9XR_002386 [Flavobacterium sp.]|jgi:hypothetical protein
MKIFSKIIFFFLLASFWFVSSSSNSGNNNDIVLLKKLNAKVLGNTNEFIFTYNGAKWNTISYFKFDGTTENGYFKVEYTRDLITSILEYNKSAVLLSKTKFNYNESILKEVIKEDSFNKRIEKILFTYTNQTVEAKTYITTNSVSNKLISTELMIFANNKLVQKEYKTPNNFNNNTTTFEHDNFNHPLKNVTGITEIYAYMNCYNSMFSSFGIEGNSNNRIGLKLQGTNGYQLNFITEYTNNNFPKSKVNTANSPGNYEFQYSYY